MNARAVWLRRVAFGLLLAVLLFAALTARVVAEGEGELAKSDAAFDRGNLRDAILYARRAAVLYAPGAPHVARAFARLRAIALGAESTGQLDAARQAWGAARAAALETRHFSTPRAEDLARANASLIRLAGGPEASPGAREQVTKALSRDDAPDAVWVVVLGAGFALFAAALGSLVLGGIAPSGALNPRGVALSAALAVAGVVAWGLAVYRA
jgi:hypothetical protein